ncbi:MAG: nucleotidyltransferase [Fimbriimonadaceae bacterium]|nr:nucleotidyltransferase [Alphaproteobacteria bacterium]
MTNAISDGFEALVARLIPPFSEPEHAEINLSNIERCLKSAFDMDYLVTFGSTGHGTNVAGYSAIDCFAVIDKKKLLEESGKCLVQIKKCLAEHFADVTLTEGRPVISIPFGDGRSERHHIVPAFPADNKGEYDIYGIPGPSDRWIKANPGGHSAWINRLNDEADGMLKPFVRVVKAWNYFNGEPLWSFYLEVCAADFIKGKSPVVYSSELMLFFTQLAKKFLEPIEQPESSNELIYGTSKDDREAALNVVRNAALLAREARKCEANGEIADANYFWRKMFNWRSTAAPR